VEKAMGELALRGVATGRWDAAGQR
jgi:hypothetical protein